MYLLLQNLILDSGWAPQLNIGSEIVLALSFAVLNFFYKHYPQHVTSGARNIMKVTVGTEESPDRGKILCGVLMTP